jgi:hypothetical protein
MIKRVKGGERLEMAIDKIAPYLLEASRLASRYRWALVYAAVTII